VSAVAPPGTAEAAKDTFNDAGEPALVANNLADTAKENSRGAGVLEERAVAAALVEGATAATAGAEELAGSDVGTDLMEELVAAAEADEAAAKAEENDRLLTGFLKRHPGAAVATQKHRDSMTTGQADFGSAAGSKGGEAGTEEDPGESAGAGGAEEALANIATGDPSTAAPVTPKGALPRDEKAEAIMLSPSGYDSEFEPISDTGSP
jgi:hypothetical protein